MKSNQIIIVLVLLNLLFVGFNSWNQSKQETVFVLTPMIDVWPDSLPLSQDEKKQLEQKFSFQPESRGLKQVYSHMGATLSFHDLLRGIQFLETSKKPLSEAQKKQVFEKLKLMEQEHKRLQQIQKDLIVKEEHLANILEQLEQ